MIGFPDFTVEEIKANKTITKHFQIEFWFINKLYI
jgi:hypothetical protein